MINKKKKKRRKREAFLIDFRLDLRPWVLAPKQIHRRCFSNCGVALANHRSGIVSYKGS